MVSMAGAADLGCVAISSGFVVADNLRNGSGRDQGWDTYMECVTATVKQCRHVITCFISTFVTAIMSSGINENTDSDSTPMLGLLS